jgi:SAM-dependent methyltransferase
MSGVMRYEDDAARRIEGLSETAAMEMQRGRVIAALAPRAGERILDVGCGPGHLTRELAEIVGAGGRACGADVSEPMLALARAAGAECERVEDGCLPFEAGAFDAAVATQVYEFVEDLPLALAELRRVLAPGGRAVVLDTDWDALVWHSSDPERMRRVLDGWRERVADPHLPRTLARQLRDAGFEHVGGPEVFTILDTSGAPDSYSALQIEHLGTSADGVSGEEVLEWAEDLRALARSGEYFFSLNRYLFTAS